MNRLILIGNGFDLAHGMKTSYGDFILWCVKDAILAAPLANTYTFPLITVRISNYFRFDEDEISLANWDDLNQYYREDIIASLDQVQLYQWTIPNPFIRRLILQCRDCGWVDIENEYYDELVKIQTSTSKIEKENQLQLLNKTFGDLQSLLEKYLASLTPPDVMAEYKSIFTQGFKPSDFLNSASLGSYPAKILLLNFNYTQLANSLEGFGTMAKIEINSIHGEIHNQNNPIIFGFGDELDDSYKKMENEKIRGFFKYVKSFGYFRTSHYKKLLKYLSSEKFEVYIIGLSCGLSDRTMLNMIFEHPNCRSIKLFYYQNDNSDNYRETMENIARHFHDKRLMRSLIVSFEESSPMPQSRILH